MTAFLCQRLVAAGETPGPVELTTYTWRGGTVNIRNAVGKGFWTNLILDYAKGIHAAAQARPFAFVFSCWTPGADTFHSWVIPEDVVYDALGRLPVGKVATNKKTIKIEPGKNRFRKDPESPDLSPFYVQVVLTTPSATS